MTKESDKRYDRAVIEVLRRYGVAMEIFGRASAGSPRGMESSMRHAKDAAHTAFHCLIGREPTVEELEQLPPLYELPVTKIRLDQIKPPEDETSE